jgi:two-component system invasion response regulator UvrY
MSEGLRKVIIVDDHVLLRKGLANLVKEYPPYIVILKADNGRDLIAKISPDLVPDLALLDVNMPEMDGFETAGWLKENYPSVKCLALSMYDHETSIIRMVRHGARGYILKDTDPSEFKRALDDIYEKGYYFSDLVSGNMVHSILSGDDNEHNAKKSVQLNKKEIEFLKLACTEFTYKEIAERLNVSPRTVDGYRDGLFDKLEVRTRVGLVLYAIKHGIYVV